ncbi:MAG: glycosyltransferase family 4 protein [Chloroflexi bacterium]|nr:glycosyltransferase family 4 protein [Chloroflexota bacterium]
MRINYTLLALSVSGGVQVICCQANGLIARGHKVTLTTLFGHLPDHMDVKADIIRPSQSVTAKLRRRALREIGARGAGEGVREKLFDWLNVMALAEITPDCDVNVATSYETALPVYLSRRGKGFYFMQHWEELIVANRRDPVLARIDAHQSYLLPLRKIASSSWLKRTVREEFGESVPVVNGAIDHKTFRRIEVPRESPRPRVLSYGGARHRWKGFEEAVEAMRIVYARMPEAEWIVYGDSSVPPQNGRAPFRSAGMVVGEDLARLYSSADVMLCPSWYESFPVYPLEAMACGLAVVTTPYGTEDYAVDGVNALVVPPKEPEQLADAVITLLSDEPLRRRLAEHGVATARRFTWDHTAEAIERVFREDALSEMTTLRTHRYRS